jgi:hypothetical protein
MTYVEHAVGWVERSDCFVIMGRAFPVKAGSGGYDDYEAAECEEDEPANDEMDCGGGGIWLGSQDTDTDPGDEPLLSPGVGMGVRGVASDEEQDGGDGDAAEWTDLPFASSQSDGEHAPPLDDGVCSLDHDTGHMERRWSQ